MASIHLITGKGRFNYPYVFKPREEEDDKDARYTIDVLFPKKDRETIKELRKAIWEAIIANKEFLKLKGNLRDIDDLPESFIYPLKDGDRKNNAGEEYEGCFYITPWSKDKPGVVGPDPKREIKDPQELYSGCYGRISLSIGTFDYKGKRGLSLFLNNIQKLGEGDRLDNRRSAFQDFDDGTGSDYNDYDDYDDKPKKKSRDYEDDYEDRPKKRRQDDDYDDRPARKPTRRDSWLD